MMNFILKSLAIIHFISVGSLVLYGIHRIWFLFNWYNVSGNTSGVGDEPALPDDFPRVTVQLPLFNEQFVAVRLLDAVAAMNWPKNRLDVQVLDDSTDETVALVDERVTYWKEKGVDITVFRRSDRTGFKAGALSNALKEARGEFIAVFDADFIPPDDFLMKTVAYFSENSVGMVQTRWGFLNGDHSWLTAVQTLLIGHHFDIEHRVRFSRNLFFNFNGTAGIWRKEAIESSGGWQSDTVTEDLDLSYRAQMNGWRFVYLHDYEVPSELPVTMASLRGQQQRWAMGSVQTALKILPGLLSSRQPLVVKVEAMFHLLANLCWIMGCISIVTLFPAVLWRIGIGSYQMMCFDIPLFIGSGGAILLYFFLYARTVKKGENIFRVLIVPLLCIGLAPGITLKIMQGGFKKGGIFKRTPKFGITGKRDLPGLTPLYHLNDVPYILLNLPLLVYTTLPLVFAWHRATWVAMPFLLLFPVGLMLVIISDLRDLLR